VRLGIGGGFPKCGNSGIFQLPQATPEALAIFSTTDQEKGIKIFQSAKIRLCPTKRISTVASEKRVQAFNPEDTALSAPTADYEFHPVDQVN